MVVALTDCSTCK